MRRPYSLLLTGLPTMVALTLLLGCPSKSGGKVAEPAPIAPEVPKLAVPLPLTPEPAAVPGKQPKPTSTRPHPAKVVASRTSVPTAAPAAAPAPTPVAAAPTAPDATPALAPAATPVVPAPAPIPPSAAVPPPHPAVTYAAPSKAAFKTEAKASYRRLVASYGAQMALATPTNGGLRLAAGGPSVALGLHTVWNLPRGLRLRPRLDYTVFASETRSSTAPPLPQTLDTKVSSLALGADLLVPAGQRWSVGLAVSELRWSVASTNTVTPTLGGSMSLSGTSHWTRLGLGPVVTLKLSDRLEVEARALSSHYGYENQPASTASLGLLWRF